MKRACQSVSTGLHPSKSEDMVGPPAESTMTRPTSGARTDWKAAVCPFTDPASHVRLSSTPRCLCESNSADLSLDIVLMTVVGLTLHLTWGMFWFRRGRAGSPSLKHA